MRRAKSVSELTRRNVEAIAKMERAAEEHRTFGDRVADGFAAVVGSWSFIVAQSVILGAWVVVNVVAWSLAWDPYPFILLNLVLSFQAAYASPIIMMSQNRQARLSEQRNRLDLQINLLAEQETTVILRMLRKLCEKEGIDLDEDPSVAAFEQATKPENVVRQIERMAEASNEGSPRA
jgi:uncharacterized membrane protein